MASVLLSVDHLSDDDVDTILARSAALRSGAPGLAGRRRVLSLIFFEASLRTRVGFIVAAGRLGWHTVDVFEKRHSPVSQMESWSDTLRTVAGYSDVIVARPNRPLGPEDQIATGRCSLINGGDVGPAAEHPSQALIDVFAMEQLVGRIDGLRLAIVGDPRMRSVRSLMALLARRPPSALSLVADAEHLQRLEIPPALRSRVDERSWSDLRDVDAIYVAGIPHGALPIERRDQLLATAARVRSLSARCLLLSPMPVIDEMDEETRGSARNRMFEQSDLGLYVRMALLEHVAREARGT